MNDLDRDYFPDFSTQGYQIDRVLGNNRAGGRVTYLATNLGNRQQVVIKQFQFAKINASWSDYAAHQREIQVLQQLNSPSIPKYLDSFETIDGFCLVQEYKDAPSLAKPQQFSLEEIEKIAIAVLEVLVYLQQQVPPVIHRDIKPENLLVDKQREIAVYLVDFGLAKIGGEEVAASSAVKGTLGFMPPEQIFNRQLTEASDLYSLGVTLICLLTETKSAEIGNLVDENYSINFKPLLPKLNPQFAEWLSKMVAPNWKNRYANAAIALQALQSNDREKKHRISFLTLGVLAAGAIGAIVTFTPLKPHARDPFSLTTGNAIEQLQTSRECLGCNLSGANLSGMDLSGVNLTGANLSNANLTKTNLKSAELKSVKLIAANLIDADLRGAYLQYADLTNANLTDAKLASADLRNATMPDGSIHP